MHYGEVDVEEVSPMRGDDLVDELQSISLFGVVLSVLIRQHDETFMVIHTTEGTKIESGFVSGIER